MTKCFWQRLQIEIKCKIFENRKTWIEIENWRERFSRTCVNLKISNSIVLQTDEIVALKYNVMRFCMKRSLFSKLRLLKLREKHARNWCCCKFIDFDFSKNMRCKSFSMIENFEICDEKTNRQCLNANFDFLTEIHFFYFLLCFCFSLFHWRVTEQNEKYEKWIEMSRKKRSIRCFDRVTI